MASTGRSAGRVALTVAADGIVVAEAGEVSRPPR